MAAARARRSFLITAGALAPALLGLPRLVRAAAQCGAGVLVGAPAGPRQALLREVLDPLLAPAGLVPVYQTAGALAQRTRIRAEIGARRPTLDLVVLRDRDLQAIQAEGGLAPIDAQAVPRSAALLAPFKATTAIAHAWTGLVLVYDKSKFKTPPDSLAALLQPTAQDTAKDADKEGTNDTAKNADKDGIKDTSKNADKDATKDTAKDATEDAGGTTKDPADTTKDANKGAAEKKAGPPPKDRIGLLDGMAGTLAVAGSLAAGKGPSDLDAGRAWLTALREQGARAYPDEAALARAFRRGQVRAALVWRSTVLQWKKDGLDLASAVPREGLIPTVYEAAPVAAGPDRACAAAYLNALLDPKVQQAFAARLYLAPTVDDAALPPETQAAAFTPEEIGRVVKRDMDLLARSEAALNTFWSTAFHS